MTTPNPLKTMVVFGATSAIAAATARVYARQGYAIHLVARDRMKLDAVADDLAVHGASAITCHVADLANLDDHPRVWGAIVLKSPAIDVMLLAHGILGQQEELVSDRTAWEYLYRVNFLSMVSLLTLARPHFIQQAKGCIIGISSVAGDRGRQSNYVYGSSKAALSTYLQGLRNEMTPHGVQVLTIKPGFVSTPMTQHLTQGPLYASASRVAAGIARAAASGRNVAYVPWFWFFIMTIIKAIPESIFKKLKL